MFLTPAAETSTAATCDLFLFSRLTTSRPHVGRAGRSYAGLNCTGTARKRTKNLVQKGSPGEVSARVREPAVKALASGQAEKRGEARGRDIGTKGPGIPCFSKDSPMDISIARALLCQIHDQLTADDGLVAWYRGRRRRRALASALKLQFDAPDASEAAPDLVAAARRFWGSDPGVRIDDRARQTIDRDGIWLSGWVLARTGVAAYDCIEPERIAAAIGRLPPLAREVLRLHSDKGLDYRQIAARLGLSMAVVQDQLAGALLALDTLLHAPGIQDADDSKPIA